jgi:hypothetical protein
MEAAIGPGDQVENDFFVGSELGSAKDDAAAILEDATPLFDHDPAFAELAFEDLPNLQTCIGEDAVLVQGAAN